MTAYLLDVNCLVALSWPGHTSHNVAQRWFAHNSSKGWATCPLVEAGFIRILSNPAFSPHAVAPKEAIEALATTTAHPTHQFWADDISVFDGLKRIAQRIVGHNQVMDAYLVALAIHHRGKLAALDQRLARTFPEGSPERSHIELIG